MTFELRFCLGQRNLSLDTVSMVRERGSITGQSNGTDSMRVWTDLSKEL